MKLCPLLLAALFLSALSPLTAQAAADDDSELSSALQSAIASNDAKTTMALMARLQAAAPDLLIEGRSPALLAIAAGNTALCQQILEAYPALLETGAEVARYQWRTPLFLAVERGDKDLVVWLNAHHVKLDAPYWPFDRPEVPANALAFARDPDLSAYLKSLGLPPLHEVEGAKSPTPAWTVNDSNVNLRSAPDAKAAVVGKLQKGDQVLYFGNTNFQTAIGGVRAYWFKVTTKTHLTGWVFGAFLESPWNSEE